MPSCDITDIQGLEPSRHLANSNGLISGYVEYDHSLYTVDGVKTGTTETAGYCLTASANNAAGRRIIVAVFNSTGDVQRAVDAKTLLDFAFSETKDN